MNRKELEKKKNEGFSGIKYQIEQIKALLGKMERKENFTLKKDNHNYFYQNNTTGAIEHHLGKIKEIFDEAENEESDLIMKEKDEEDERSASIGWPDYLKAVSQEE